MYCKFYFNSCAGEYFLAQKLEMESTFSSFLADATLKLKFMVQLCVLWPVFKLGKGNKVSLLVVLCVQLFGSGFVFVVS